MANSYLFTDLYTKITTKYTLQKKTKSNLIRVNPKTN